ncbi:MAG: hypothetical protein H8D95_01540 [Candidatus Endolissoclinum sp.]|jgi:hypothetical protein|nr:hypothetical protein [Candidatus Endolissoclinum sp.]
MIFSDSKSGYRIVVDSYKRSDEAYQWCSDNLPLSEWTVVQDENAESFYFENEQYAQNFLLVFGGRCYKHDG